MWRTTSAAVLLPWDFILPTKACCKIEQIYDLTNQEWSDFSLFYTNGNWPPFWLLTACMCIITPPAEKVIQYSTAAEADPKYEITCKAHLDSTEVVRIWEAYYLSHECSAVNWWQWCAGNHREESLVENPPGIATNASIFIWIRMIWWYKWKC